MSDPLDPIQKLADELFADDRFRDQAVRYLGLADDVLDLQERILAMAGQLVGLKGIAMVRRPTVRQLVKALQPPEARQQTVVVLAALTLGLRTVSKMNPDVVITALRTNAALSRLGKGKPSYEEVECALARAVEQETTPSSFTDELVEAATRRVVNRRRRRDEV
jgi:hypothetical protein